MKDILQIKPEFEQLSIPLPQEGQEKLEEQLIRQGCMEPVISWHGYILDGHKRYRICKYEEIEFEVQEADFDTQEEAITWICRERLAGMEHRNAAYKYLTGKWYITQKNMNRKLRKERSAEIRARLSMDRAAVASEIYGVAPMNGMWDSDTGQEDSAAIQISGEADKRNPPAACEEDTAANADLTGKEDISAGAGNDAGGNVPVTKMKKKIRSDSIWDTSVMIASILGMDHSTVEKYGIYAAALDRIAASEPALCKAILSGEVFFNHANTVKMSHADERKLVDIRRKALSSVEERTRKRAGRKKKKEMTAMKEATAIPLSVGIKEMPAFDPDMELNGLGYTIPSWINRIARAEQNTDMLQATVTAKEQLTDMLKRLKEQIEHTLEVLG